MQGTRRRGNKRKQEQPPENKEPLINEILREAKKAFKLQDYQEIKMYAVRRLTELGIPIRELEVLLE